MLHSLWQGFTSLTDPQRKKARNKWKEGSTNGIKRAERKKRRLEKKPECFGK
jgi:hypothetical protein